MAIVLFVIALIVVSDCYWMQVVQGKTNPGIRLRVTNNGLQYGKCFSHRLETLRDRPKYDTI